MKTLFLVHVMPERTSFSKVWDHRIPRHVFSTPHFKHMTQLMVENDQHRLERVDMDRCRPCSSYCAIRLHADVELDAQTIIGQRLADQAQIAERRAAEARGEVVEDED